MSDGMSISERAIALREARHRARKAGSGRVESTRTPSRDPWYYAGAPGEYGHPNIDPGPRRAPEGLLEMALEAYGGLTRPDTRFINLARRATWFLR
jgi:hypothetical protein